MVFQFIGCEIPFVSMFSIVEPHKSFKKTYQHLLPQCMSIVKQVNNQLFAHLQFDAYNYGIASLGQICTLRLEKTNGIWRMHLHATPEQSMQGLKDFVEVMNSVVFDHLGIDLDAYVDSLKEFESKDIFFSGVDIKANAAPIKPPSR